MAFVTKIPEDTSLLQQIRKDLDNDPFAKDIKHRLQQANANNDFEEIDGLVYFKGLLYVSSGPARLQTLQSRHDLPTTRHFGVNKTIELVSRDFWWFQMWKLVKEFVQTCDVCARAKTPRHRPYGLLHPFVIPNEPWASISMDFITDLPLSRSFDAILVVVDRFTKMAHFIPYNKNNHRRRYRSPLF